MSYCSLWGIDKDFYGDQVEEFGNSWLFVPPALDVLSWKYIPGSRLSFLARVAYEDTKFQEKLNDKINESANQSDRVMWELSNHQVFSSKDAKFVATAIRKFCDKTLKEFMPGVADHIVERFKEIATAIENLDGEKHLYFVLKGNSIDDSVENWFWMDDPNGGVDPVRCSLRGSEQHRTEFVVVEGDEIIGFVSNLDFNFEA